jgi:hypothetical protein
MSKAPTPRRKARAPIKPAPTPANNPRLGAQTRRILTKHYRAKHGVR